MTKERPDMPDTGEFLSVKQLCASLEIDKSTLYRWRKAGHGPQAIKVGNIVRFKKADVDAWLESNNVAQAAS